MIKLERLTSTILPVASAILVGYLLINNQSVFVLMVAVVGFLAALHILSIANAFLLLLLSVSIVIPIIQLPFSDFTYIRLDDIVWIIILFVTIRKGYLSQIFYRIKIYPNVKPLAIFHVLAAFSLLRIIYLTDTNLTPLFHSIWYQFKLLQCTIIFIIGLVCFHNEKRDLLLKSAILFGAILAVIAIAQFMNIIPRYEYHMLNKFSPGQITSVLSPNSAHLGIYMVTAIFLSYAAFVLCEKTSEKILLMIIIALMIIALILTGSRSSWVGYLVGNIVFLLVINETSKKVIIFLFMIFVLLISAYISSDIKEILFSSIYDEHRIGSAMYRVDSYSRFIEVIKSDPVIIFLGVGFMNWRYTLVQSTEITWAHNNYLSVFGELGIAGLIVFLWFWFSTLSVSKKISNHGDVWGKSYISILSAYLFASLTAEILYPVWAFENLLMFIMLISGVILSKYQYNVKLSNEKIS